jgi:hypothetical protein
VASSRDASARTQLYRSQLLAFRSAPFTKLAVTTPLIASQTRLFGLRFCELSMAEGMAGDIRMLRQFGEGMKRAVLSWCCPQGDSSTTTVYERRCSKVGVVRSSHANTPIFFSAECGSYSCPDQGRYPMTLLGGSFDRTHRFSLLAPMNNLLADRKLVSRDLLD